MEISSSVEMINGGGDHVVELVSNSSDAEISSLTDEIAPLLSDGEKAKINIFTVSYPRRKQPKVINQSLTVIYVPLFHICLILFTICVQSFRA